MDAAPAPPALTPAAVEALRAQLQARTGAPVVLRETHISWVLLARHLAFKLKKPVRLPFVDFGSAALREQACLAELRLNRRLAPALYLGVVPVRGTARAPRWGSTGPVLDHAVAMRRFPDDALLADRLARGGIGPAQLERLGERLADFHARAAAVPADAPWGTPAQARGAVRAVLDQLQAAGGGERLAALRAWCEAEGERLAPLLQSRRDQGRVRECHGDLHLGNLVLLDGEITPFDGVEFEPALRWTDVMADLGFLTMDLQARGRPELAFTALDAWLQRGGDHGGTRVLRWFQVYRALVRALVASLSPGGGGPDYLGCAEALVAAGRAPRLLITCGPSGCGKSTVARALLAAAGAVRIRSDVERKRLFGLQALQRSAAQGLELYTPEATRRTFEHLAGCARAALEGGFPVIVDAAFLSRAHRRDFRDLARALGVPFTILACTAPPETLRRRVAARAAAGTDPSEATLEVLQHQLATADALDGEERACAIEVATDAPPDVPALAARWLRIRTARR